MPYREKRTITPAPSPRAGVVADMVRQFADPYAFLRELVQNSIDAGAGKVEVSLTLARDGRALTRVVDDGCGMTPHTIENALTTLFSSTKDGDPGMIGKYGVGFISVFALEPRVVEVVTWRDGTSHRLELGADHRWVLERLGAREGSGTSVTLEKSMSVAAFAQHRRAATVALRRWCRHVHVPLYLSALDEADPESSSSAHVDIPFEVAAPVSVTERMLGDTIVVGVSAGSELGGRAPEDGHESATSFAGFYKRGLTLHESEESPLGGLTGLHLKVESDRLAHTLSRDDVLRDDAYHGLLARARRLAKRELPRAVAEQLAAVARFGSGGDALRYAALIAAACAPSIRLRARDLRVALVDPLEGTEGAVSVQLDRVLDLTPWREPLLTAESSDPLTRALASTGRPVLWNAHPRVEACLAEICARLPLLSRRACAPVSITHTLLRELPPSERRGGDDRLLSHVQAALRRAGHECDRVVLCNVLGAPSQRFAFVVPEQRLWLFTAAQLATSSRAWGRRRVLALDAGSEPVDLAREKVSSPIAGTLLARMIALDVTGVASARVNDRLLDPQIEGAG